jgi:signal transduction histidine kinase
MALVGGSAGSVTRWDDDDQALVAVGTSVPTLEAQRLRLGEGASGRAAEQRSPVLLCRADGAAPDPVLAAAHIDSVIAVPLLHEARLIGTLAVGSVGKQFTQEDAGSLEMLATTTVSALVAVEHARLDGVMLAARTAQHELNNQLAVARGYAEMLAGAPDLPPHLSDMAEEVKHAADEAANTVRQLRGVAHIHEHHWPGPTESTINLPRSQEPAPWHATCFLPPPDHRRSQ